MPTPSLDPRPDIEIGLHPDFGIVATNVKQLAAADWMLERLGFQPIPDQPTLHMLTDQGLGSRERVTRAVALLRKADYHVETDPAFDPSLAPAEPPDAHAPAPGMAVRVGPDIAFADHPRLGLVAATTDSVPHATKLLNTYGWQHHPSLDIYTLPPNTPRTEGLDTVARTTVAMHRAGLQVALHPRLARAAADRPTPDTPLRTRQAALATSPARTRTTTTSVAPAAVTPTSRPADPRIAYAHTR